jgi:hypothetical protein
MGAFIMSALDNGMSMMDVATFWQYIVKGPFCCAVDGFRHQTPKLRAEECLNSLRYRQTLGTSCSLKIRALAGIVWPARETRNNIYV